MKFFFINVYKFILLSSVSTLCHCSTEFDSDVEKYSIFRKTGNYEEVKNILKQMNEKDRRYPKESMKRDFVSAERNTEDSADTEERKNMHFVEDVFEGDIILTVPQARLMLQSKNRKRKKRKVMRNPIGKWPTKLINYAFDESITDHKKMNIEAGVRHWDENTCLRFRENRTGDYLLFVNGAGCYSNVGHVGGMQEVSLGEGCEKLGNVAHEIGHILGFWHEQSRPDRETFIRINKQNVIKNADGNFDMLPSSLVNDFGVAYDIGSVMHYGSKAFSVSSKKRTIDTLDPNYVSTPGQRSRLSFIDIKQMNYNYCSDVCLNYLPCEHGGYPDPSGDGQRCMSCRCPDGFSGTFCLNVQPSHGDCGGLLTADAKWQTISSYGNDQQCIWLIKAPDKKKVRFELTELTMHCQEACSTFVEVKYKNNFEQTGSRFCCDRPLTPIVSYTDEMVVIYNIDADGLMSSSFTGRFKIDGSHYVEPKPKKSDTQFNIFQDPKIEPSHGDEQQTISTTKASTVITVPFTQPPLPPIFTAPQWQTPQPQQPKHVPVQIVQSSWTEWSPWSKCSKPCGGCGLQERRRQCYGTSSCPGYDLQRGMCNLHMCQVQPKKVNMCSYPVQIPCQQNEADFNQQNANNHLALNQFRKQNDVSPNAVLVQPINPQQAFIEQPKYCVKYVNYPCADETNRMASSHSDQACCEGFEQFVDMCRTKL